MRALAIVVALLLTGCATSVPIGAYRTSDGRLIDISPAPDGGEFLTISDFARGTWRALTPQGRGRYTFGPGILTPKPVAGTIAIHADTATLAYTNEAPVRATRVRFRELPMTWRNDDAELHGTLLLPEGNGPFPSVILTQASGSSDRSGYRTTAHWFAHHGIAALIYDRRGVGKSTGDARTTGFPELAEDAVRAAAALKQLPQIEAKHIGVWGQSQGGWIAPLAAARTSDISWVIAQSGPAVTATEQERYRIEQQARLEGLTEEEIAEALAFERLTDRFRRLGEGRDELIATSTASRNKRWASLVFLADDTLPQRLADRRRDHFWLYDPLPEYRKVTVPILVLYGDRDSYLPVAKSAELWREILSANGNRDGSVVVLEKGTHGHWIGEADSSKELAVSPGYHPSYWPALEAFLRRYVMTRS